MIGSFSRGIQYLACWKFLSVTKRDTKMKVDVFLVRYWTTCKQYEQVAHQVRILF